MKDTPSRYYGRTRRIGRPASIESNFMEHVLRAHLDEVERARLTLIYPYFSRRTEWVLKLRQQSIRALGLDRPSVLVTHENTPPRWDIAGFQIGFDPHQSSDRYLRFPNWMLQVHWPELATQPPNPRYGTRLEVERLMTPLKRTFPIVEDRNPGAVLFSTHLREPRGSLYQKVDETLGCEGFGKAFTEDTRLQGGKYDLCLNYRFALCPENSIGPGYITEKIPEAFYAGCVPITWCRPEDLELDFNPKAVVNLYGLSDQEQTALLQRLREDDAYLDALRSQPLLLERPSLEPLVSLFKRMLAG